MERVTGIDGQKYIPTSAPPQIHRQNTVAGNNNVNHYSSNPPSTPPRIGQRSKTARGKTQKSLQEMRAKSKWAMKKKIIIGSIIGTVVGAVVITAILLGGLLRPKPVTTTSTTAATPVITAYWDLDDNSNDFYNVYNGILVNSPSYFNTTDTQPYVAYGSGLSLASSSSQYMSVLYPILNLSYRSFTIETWIYPTISNNGDFGIFGQCQCPTCSNQCLYLIIRSYQLYVSFSNNDLSGSVTLTANTWYQIAFVYNSATQQQILYVNGVQDTIKSNSNSYQGTSGALWIGASQVYVSIVYFNGYIDNFKITTRAKSSTEILNDATLTAYFPFDLPNPTYDSGPNGLNGSATNTSIVTGRVNEAMNFSGASSYFQAFGFYQIGYGITANSPFSVSLWISPWAAISCTIAQVSPQLTSSCNNFIGLSASSNITAQILVQGYSWPGVYGPMAPLNTWTHISYTYGLSNGVTLYVNGMLFGYTGSVTFTASGTISYLLIGYYSSCSSYYLTNAAYEGSVDEVYVHARELTQSEVTVLANP